MTTTTIVASYAAGCASFLTPCVLPMMPLFATYLVNDSIAPDGAGPGRKSIRGVLAFCLGMTLTFVALGMTASALGSFLRSYEDVFRGIIGALLIALSIHYLGIYRIGWLDRQLKWSGPRRVASPLMALLFGMAFAFGWTPCTGPILSSILAMAATSTGLAEGALLLFVYSLGLSLPFVLIALFVERARPVISWLMKHSRKVELVCGVALFEMGRLFLGWF